MKHNKTLLIFGISLFALASCGSEPQANPKSLDIIYNNNAIRTFDCVVGETYQFSAKVNPEKAEQTVDWSTSDASIISIDAEGLATVNGAGEAVIKASSKKDPTISTNLYIFADHPVKQLGVGSGLTEDDPIYIGNEGHDEPLEIYFIEMRQMYADSIYIKKGNFDILIDAGEAYDGTYVNEFLKEKMNDNRLDILMASHQDGDHINGMKNALKDIEFVSTCIDYGGIQNSAYNDIKQEYIKKGTKYHTAFDSVTYQNDSNNVYYLCDDFTLQILDTGNYTKNNEKGGSNGNSVACLFTYKDFKFFSAGDLTTGSETTLLRREELPEVTLYKASHHGSNGSNSTSLLEVLNPKGVAISAARASTGYGDAPSDKPSKKDTNCGLVGGHPYEEAMERFYQTPNIKKTLDVRWNAVNGTMCYTTDGSDSFEFKGSTPKKGYYDLSKTGGVPVWNEELQDFENKVTGEENLKLHETVVFKARGYDAFVKDLL